MKQTLAAFLFSSLLMTQVGVVSAQVPTAGVIGHWPLDGNANDTSGNGHNGTITGATSTTGLFGGAFNFDGTAGIDVGNLDFSSGQFTVSGWVRTTDPAVTEIWRNWIAKLNYGTGDATFELYMGDGRVAGGANSPQFAVWNTGSTVVNIGFSSSVNLRDGDWHMVTASSTSGSQKLYLDGALVATDSYAGTLPLTTTSVVIGGGNFGPFHHPWVGDIDEVLIYNRALSGAEVSQLLNPTLTPQQATQLLAIRITRLVSDGILSPGQGNSLMTELQAAIQQMNQGNPKAAINQLRAFINEVGALMKSGRLVIGQGQPLIDAANDVISRITL